MKAKFVAESMEEFNAYNPMDDEDEDDVVMDEIPGDVYVEDDEDEDEDDIVMDELPSDVYVEDEDEDDDMFVQDEFETAINNELKIPEYARRTITFRVKGMPDVIEGVAMAKTRDGKILMKVGNTYKKFDPRDIVEEE